MNSLSRNSPSSNLLSSDKTNGNSGGKSSEEKDHLIRSTKKIKGANVEDDDTMLDTPSVESQVEFAIAPTETPSPAEKSAQDPIPKSFKDALTARSSNERPFDENLDDLSTDDEFEDDGDEIDEVESLVTEVLGIPRISSPKKLLAKIRRPWKDCLIIKLLGKRVGYRLLMAKIRKLWDLQGDFEAIDLDSGFFLIKFQMKEDCAYGYTRGPWIVLDHYLTVRKWQPDFKPAAAEEVKNALWVRFPQLPIEYYNEKVIFHIAKALGKPL
ncbi:hypothetical protein ACSBR1_021097 [Camellia fascicularis]